MIAFVLHCNQIGITLFISVLDEMMKLTKSVIPPNVRGMYFCVYQLTRFHFFILSAINIE